jgi:hypothetical protein
MKNKFIRLIGGAIAYCTAEKRDKNGDVLGFYGYNLASPYLRQKNFKIELIERVLSEHDEGYRDAIRSAVQPDTFYLLKEDNKYHSVRITNIRYEFIVNMLR